MNIPRLSAKIGLAVLSLLGCFALFEAGSDLWLTRIADEQSARRYLTPEQYKVRLARLDDVRSQAMGESAFAFETHRHIGYVGVPGYRMEGNRHDSHGYRGEEIPDEKAEGEFRIVCIGGSTTYTNMVRDSKLSYPSQMESDLHDAGFTNVRVINAGLPGYTTYESLINFQLRVLDLEPDLVVVYHAVNDVIARMVHPFEEYRGDNSGFALDARGAWAPKWYERSDALRILMIRAGRSQSPLTLNQRMLRLADSSAYLPFFRQLQAGSYPSGVFESAPVEEMFERNPPVYFERNLEHIVLIAQHHDIQTVLCTFKANPSVDDSMKGQPDFFEAIEEHNGVIAGVARKMGVPLCGFADEFPDDPTLFVDSVHLNAKGAGLKARMIGRFLVERDLIPLPSDVARASGAAG